MLCAAIGPKVLLVGKFLPTGKHRLSLFPRRKVKVCRRREARALKYFVPERPAIPTAAATNRPLGGGFESKKKMAQPGTDAQAMEKPVQTLLVPAGGANSSENAKSSTGSP
ncbi:hypothetical protein VULLAG_LOCUS22704 [Vulpes lagopus]